jgi:hypothetical protein
MADLFDMRVGGAGWHITSHLIAIAALFVACFAIAGYITFRDDSIPAKALDNSGNADQDITVNDITATGDVTVSGKSTLAGGYGTTAIQIPADGALTFNTPSFVDFSNIQALTAQAAGVVAANNTILPTSTHVNLTAGAADLRVYINNTGVPVGHTVGITNGANACELSIYDSGGLTPRVLSVGTGNSFVTITSTSLILGAADHLEALLTTASKLYRCTKVTSTDWIIYPMYDAAPASNSN